jgi:hypothetical protein
MIYAILAVVMYIVDVPTLTKGGKLSHLCTLLREFYRQNGKVKNRTLANLTHCNPKEVDAMRLALKHKDDLTVLRSVEDIELEQGMSVGVAWAVYDVARRYDVTPYFEGEHNELADWGYDRDKKRGKKQVVVGLLCDEGGDPVSVEVFRGNTRDFDPMFQPSGYNHLKPDTKLSLSQR